MAETTPPPSGTLAGASGRELRQLQQFLLYLGSALTAAGEAVNQVEEHLRRVAAAYGAPRARISVLPTYLVVALEPGRPATLEPTRQLRGMLRLDQTAALFEVLKAAQHREPSPEEGSRRIREIVDMAPRFGASITISGHVVLTVGICLTPLRLKRPLARFRRLEATILTLLLCDGVGRK